jgi:imidazolonepropionase-like amidohydrolase
MRVELRGARVIVGDGSDLDEASVVVDGDRIVSIGGDGTGEVTIDLEGRTLVPGFIDLHTHMVGGDNAIGHGDEATTFKMSDPLAKAVLDSVDAARVTLQAGVTSAREIGARDYIDVFLKKAQASRQIDGPRMLTTGPGIAMTGGHGNHWDPAGTADGVIEVVRRVRQLVAHGVDVIKVVSSDGPETLGRWWTVQSTPEEVEAAFAEARRLGRRTASHSMGGAAITNVVRAGVDTVEHGWYLSEESARLMADRGTWLVPTLGNVVDIIRKGPALEMPWATMMAQDEEAIFDRMRMAAEVGVRFAMGSDCGGNESRHHGCNLDEIPLYVRCGMSPLDGIQSATLDAARAVRIDSLVGSIEAGKLADLVVLDGDPTADVSVVVSGVVGVVQGGEVVRDDLGLLEKWRRMTPPRTRTATAIGVDDRVPNSPRPLLPL